MESLDAVTILSALAHHSRIALFRLLVRAGDDGISAGTLAESLGLAPSTLSHHIAQLEQSGIVRSRRESRHIYYAVNMDGFRGLLSYLIDDCCGGAPESCGFGRLSC